MGVECATGRVLWETPNPRGWKMSHASVMPMTRGTHRFWVYPALGGVVGVFADGPQAGRVAWETEAWNNAIQVPSAVSLGDGRLFLTAGYGRGSMLLRVQDETHGFRVTPLYRLDRSVFACEQHTPIFYRGCLFGILPRDAGARRCQLVCLSPDGEVVWTSGSDYRFGLGPFLVADNKLLILDDWGTLTLARVDTDQFQVLARAKVMEGRDAWAPMALAGGKLLLRDSKTLLCLDVARHP